MRVRTATRTRNSSETPALLLFEGTVFRRPSLHVLDDRLGAQTLHDDGLAFVDHPMHMAAETVQSDSKE